MLSFRIVVLPAGEGLRDAAELDEAIDVRKDGVRRDAKDRNPGLHDPCRPGSNPAVTTVGSPAYCWTIDSSPVYRNPIWKSTRNGTVP